MTVRELYDMIRWYGLDPDAKIMIQPLAKDKPREARSLTTDRGRIMLTAYGSSRKKK